MRVSTIRSLWLVALALVLALPVQAQHQLTTPAWFVDAADVEWFSATANNARGATLNPVTGHVLVATREGGNQVISIEAADGSVVGSLSTTGIAGGVLPFNMIAASADGQIFATNLVTDASASPFKIYRWANEDAQPELVYEGAPSAHRYGDSFFVYGSGSNVYVYASGGQSNPNIAEFVWDGQALGAPRLIPVAAGSARGGIAIGQGGQTLWINGAGTTLREVDRQTGAIVRDIPGDVTASGAMAVASFWLEGRFYVASGIRNPLSTTDILDVTVVGQETVVAQTATLSDRANANATGDLTYDRANNQLIVMATNHGVGAFNLDVLLPEVLADAEWKIQAGDRAWFQNDNATRGADYNPATDNVIVVSRTGGLNMRILHAGTGEELGMMNVSGITGGTFVLSEIAITEDGQIFGANLTVNPVDSPVRIYRWRHERAAPELVFSGTLPGPRYGDGIGVYGSGDNVDLYISGGGNDTIVRFAWNGETLTQVAALVPQAGVHRGRFGLAPISEDRMWINSAGNVMALIDTNTGEIVREVLDSPRTTAAGYLTHFELNGRQYVATGPQFGYPPMPGTPEERFVVVDVTNDVAAPVAYLTEILGTNANGNASGAAMWDSRRNNLIVMATNNAIAAYSLAEPVADPAPIAGLTISPADRVAINVAGLGTTELMVAWTTVRDGEAEFNYTWQLLAAPDAMEPILAIDAQGETSLTLTYEQIDQLLADAGIAVGESITLYHRVVATDNGTVLTGDYAQVTLVRGFLGVMTIAQARAQPLNTIVTVEGIVTRAMGRAIRLQDETGAIATFGPMGSAIADAVASGAIREGDELQVTGRRAEFREFVQIDNITSFEVLSRDNDLPAPERVTLAEIVERGAELQSKLIEVRQLEIDAAGHTTFQAGTSYRITDGTVPMGTVELRVQAATDTDIIGQPIPSPAKFVGVLGQFSTTGPEVGFQLIPVNDDDVFAQPVSTDSGPVAVAFGVEGNFPNPFAVSTTLRYDLPSDAEVRLEVYDVLGRRVLVVPSSSVPAGAGRTLSLDGSGLAAGTYMWRLTAETAGETFTETGRITLTR
jgi:hypothetical protein